MPRLSASPGAALLLAVLALPAAAKGGPVCYGFDRQPEGAQWTVDDTIPIQDLGRVEVRQLLVDGKPYGADTRFLRRVDNSIPGGSTPAMYAKNVVLRLLPKAPVTRISMRVAQQPGAAGVRPATVEVNGERHEFAGSLEQLDGRVIGTPATARLKVRLPVADGAFEVGQLVVESKAGIRSFSIGAAELHLDDICFER